jgi:1,2-dihydroxy-3-keto-5-methylthiopentene dioxygenase
MTISAWYMDDDLTSDQRLPHQQTPPAPVSADKLIELGVIYWENIQGVDDLKLAQIKIDRGYTYTDMVHLSPDKLPNYDEKIKNFYREHIHYDEEIRFCIEGSGYFDIRDENDKWIRISVQPGDMIVLPEGIYHRFTMDTNNFGIFQRLFVGEPVWTPYNRDEIDAMRNASRVKYEANFLKRSSVPVESF